MADDYQEGILAAWQGEVWGEAFFASLAKAADDGQLRGKWETLAELEAATRDCLAALVAAQAARPDGLAQAETAAAAYAQLAHKDAMRQMMTILDPAIERFRGLLDAAPEADREVVQVLVDHEVALKEFAERELADEAETSLAPVRAVIARARAQTRTG